AAGNCFRVSASSYINGRWYVGVENQCCLYNADTNERISSYNISQTTSLDYYYTMTTGMNVVIKIRLAPVGDFGSTAVDNNCYGDEPANARKQDSGSVTFNASKPDVSQPLAIPHAMYTSNWVDSAGSGSIMKNSRINSVDIYSSTWKPGEIRSVTLYKFDKNVTTATAYSTLKPLIADERYDDKWELTHSATYNSGESNESRRFVLPEGVTVNAENDKCYRVVVQYDRIRVSNSTPTYYDTATTTYVKPYLYYGTTNPVDINIADTPEHCSYEYLGWNNTKSYSKNTINKKTEAFYVLVADLPREDLSLNSATFNDFVDSKPQYGVSIKDALNQSYTTRVHNGVTKYYYYYEINSEDEYPIDNTMAFSASYTLRTDNPPAPGDQTYDCDVSVEQWNRDTYDGNYVPATNQTVKFSVPDGEPMKVGTIAGESKNPIQISNSTGSFYMNCDPSGNHSYRGHLTIKLIPESGYNVERVVVSDIYTSTYAPDANNEVKVHLRTSNVSIKVYYSRPLIRISSTNEGNKGKATIDVNTGGQTETVLNENTFTNGTFVTKGDDADVIIRPLTYSDEGFEYYYTVESIRIGNAYNNTTTVYTKNGGDVQGDEFNIEKMDDGSQYRLTMNTVQSDKYIFIQLVGKERILTSNVQVNQQIKYAGTDKYAECPDGSVTLNGSLSGNDTPLNFDGEDRGTVTMNDKATIEGSVVSGTTLSLSNITPPEDYVIESIEVERLNSSAGYTENNGIYTLSNPAPDSGTTVITVKYGLKRTEFTLNYKYYSREWNADEESNYENNNKVIGKNTQPDKTYTVPVFLTDADIKDGKITNMKVFVDNAPAIDDLYKDCKFTKFDDDHVIYNGTEVTILADQPAKEFVVKFYKNDGEQDELVTPCKNVKLNGFVKKDGEFITADETFNGSKFAYWLVKKAGTDKEITKCYSRQFNSRVTADIDVVAYYGDKAKSIALSDAIFSREQTSDGKGNISDKLFADFILSYMDETGRLFNASAAESEGVEALEGYRSGLIVEFDSTIKLEREDEAGHKLTDQEKVVFPANDTVDKNTIIGYIKGDDTTVPNTRTLINLAVNNNSYNNKNRVDKALSFNNSENARHTVLRAYYYVVDAAGNVQLTDPVYFYLYDIGNSVA
ncbi:MAG: hypothetical protein K6F88_07790, partial [Ruminococcus sp.]|nr:hypothetical protein [Ruminococcus sp.]